MSLSAALFLNTRNCAWIFWSVRVGGGDCGLGRLSRVVCEDIGVGGVVFRKVEAYVGGC